MGRSVDYLNCVVVADGDQHELPVPGELDAARALADLDSFGDGPFVGIDHRNSVALFIGHIGDKGRGGQGARKPDGNRGNQEMTPHARPSNRLSLQLAPGFGLIHAERIEFRDLMQESFLW